MIILLYFYPIENGKGNGSRAAGPPLTRDDTQNLDVSTASFRTVGAARREIAKPEDRNGASGGIRIMSQDAGLEKSKVDPRATQSSDERAIHGDAFLPRVKSHQWRHVHRYRDRATGAIPDKTADSRSSATSRRIISGSTPAG